MPALQQEGKQQVSQEDDDEEMEFQSPKRAIKVIYGQSDSESSNNGCCK
jgi:hypothetical protein